MFAGEEILLPLVADNATTLQLCARAVLQVWQDGVIQDAQTAQVFNDYSTVSFSSMKEMMIYRDENARKSWDELGADESNRNSMAHFLFTENHLMLVLDDTSSDESRNIISAVRSINEDDLALLSCSGIRGAAA